MSKIPGKMKRLNKLISLSAAGFLIGTAGAYAASDNQSATAQASQDQQQSQQQTNAPQFSDVDRNGDQKLVWTEIYAIYDDEIDGAGLREEDVMNQYDRDRSADLDPDEYVVFVTALADQPGSDISQTQGQGQAQGDQQSMDQSQQDQELTQQEPDRGSAEYYDEQDSDAVAESYEHSDAAEQSNIVQQQQEADQQAQASANGQSQGMAADQQDQMASDEGQQQSEQEGLASDQSDQQKQQSESDKAVTTTIIAITDVPDLSVEDLKDRDVVNMNGEEIGEVEDVVFGPDGAVTGLVVGVGGFWDIGDKDVFAAANELRLSGDEVVWETTLDEDALEELPEYEAPEVSSIE